jgi:hypothetical protein
MSDAYYPADDPDMMARGQAALDRDRDRHGAAWRETRAYAADQRRALAPLVPDTRRARYAVKASHCAQARAGYFYCASTPGDPCGYAPDNRYPHAGCTAQECTAPHTCGDLAAYAEATREPLG